MDPETLRLARVLWDYHHLDHTPEPSGAIFALGSHDLRVAERAARLYLDGLAPLVIMSGGLGNLTRSLWSESEARKFARVAHEMGVPEKDILVEDRSTNTGENVVFTRLLLEERGLDPPSFLLVQKPYMERRTWATFRKQWPGKPALVTSPQIDFEGYPNEKIALEDVIHIMVGDLERILIYPARGFQIEQEVPQPVLDAYGELRRRGFTGHLAAD